MPGLVRPEKPSLLVHPDLEQMSHGVPEAAAGYPAQYKDPTGQWHGFAARARVLIVNTDLIPSQASGDGMSGSDYLFEDPTPERGAVIYYKVSDAARAVLAELERREEVLHQPRAIQRTLHCLAFFVRAGIPAQRRQPVRRKAK